MDARFSDPSIMATPVQPGQTPEPTPPIDLHRHIALFRRRLRLFVGIALAVFAASIVITLQIQPRYTATAVVMLDPRQEKVVDIEQVLSGAPMDAAAVDTQVEVLKSRALAEKVVAALHLEQDPEFNPPAREGLLSFLQPATTTDTPEAQARLHASVIDRVLAHLKVARAGLTYVINVSFEARSPAKSALIANTFADRYLLEQLDAKFEATRRASDWLNSRLGGLREQVEQAEAQVQDYRAAHGLMASSEAGATITQQEISNLNTTYANAKAEEAEAEAKLNTARQQISRGSSGDDLGDALSSPVISQLRQQRATLSGQVADLSGKYGPRHPEMLKAQRQLADIDAQIQSEIHRVTSNLEAQAQVARQRAASIGGSLNSTKGSLASSNAASVKLNELQRNADSVRTLYQSFLDRFKQTTAQQGIEQSDARVVSRAKIPNRPSFPNIPLNAAIGAVLGVAAAILAMMLVEALESGLYTSEDVEKLLGVPHLGSIPTAATTLDIKRGKESKISPTRYVVEKPLSSFAEAFRNLRTSILFARIGEPVRTVAITSSLPGEGKTTTCICLGRVMAMGGTSTVVVDCDLRRRTVNRLFAEEPTVGLLEVLGGTATLDEALIRDDASGAYFLPLAKSAYTPKDVFASASMDRLLEELRRRFEVTLLDTAPILPVADTRVLAPKADVVVFLSQWKRTPRKAIENALKQLDSVNAYVAGVGLTQVDMREQARSGYGDSGYYYRSYKQYYGGGYGDTRS
jgi:exopolysaccharide transport family protein